MTDHEHRRLPNAPNPKVITERPKPPFEPLPAPRDQDEIDARKFGIQIIAEHATRWTAEQLIEQADKVAQYILDGKTTED